jgi:RNA polymerase sigma factor (sigma-70 family)
MAVLGRTLNRIPRRDDGFWENLLARMRHLRREMGELPGMESLGDGEWQEAAARGMGVLTGEAGERLARLRDELLDLEEDLVEGHLRLVLHVARRYFMGGIGALEDMDIVQEGCRGLLTAARKHDLKDYSGFCGYAVCVIRRSIIEEVSRQARLVRVPRRTLRKGVRARGLLDSFAARHGRLPTAGEMRDLLDLDLDWVLALSLLELHHVSLDADDLRELPASPGQPHLEVAEEMEIRRVREALAGLPERSKTVLALRLGLVDQRRETLKRISDILGISTERVRQIEKDALRRLRDSLYPDTDLRLRD